MTASGPSTAPQPEEKVKIEGVEVDKEVFDTVAEGNEDLQKAAEKSAEQALKDAEEDEKKFDTQLADAQEARDQLETQIGEIKQELAKLTEKKDPADAALIAQLEADIDDLQKELDKVNKFLDKANDIKKDRLQDKRDAEDANDPPKTKGEKAQREFDRAVEDFQNADSFKDKFAAVMKILTRGGEMLKYMAKDEPLETPEQEKDREKREKETTTVDAKKEFNEKYLDKGTSMVDIKTDLDDRETKNKEAIPKNIKEIEEGKTNMNDALQGLKAEQESLRVIDEQITAAKKDGIDTRTLETERADQEKNIKAIVSVVQTTEKVIKELLKQQKELEREKEVIKEQQNFHKEITEKEGYTAAKPFEFPVNNPPKEDILYGGDTFSVKLIGCTMLDPANAPVVADASGVMTISAPGKYVIQPAGGTRIEATFKRAIS